jgi:hypothetical protein
MVIAKCGVFAKSDGGLGRERAKYEIETSSTRQFKWGLDCTAWRMSSEKGGGITVQLYVASDGITLYWVAG